MIQSGSTACCVRREFLGNFLHKLGEDVVLGDEVRLAVDFGDHADPARSLDRGHNDAFLGGASGFFAGAGDTLLAKEGLGFLKIPTCFGKGFLAVHHPRVGFFAERLDE